MFNLPYNLNRIVSGLLLDYDLSTAAAVGVRLLGLLLKGVVHAGYVPEVHGRSAKVSKDHVKNLLGVLEFLLDTERIGIGAYIDASGRDVTVLCGYDLRDCSNGEVI